MHRRGFMSLAAGLCAGRLLPAQAAERPFVERHRIPLGVQLYMLSDLLKADLGGTLNAVSHLGYKTVETAGLLGKTPEEWQQALGSAGLACRAAHLSPQAFVPGPSLADDPESIARLAHQIGFGTVVASLFKIPERFDTQKPGEGFVAMLARVSAAMTEADWIDAANFLNAKGAGLKRVGLRFAYHNHNNEFAPLGNTTAMNILMEKTDPELVSFEMDAGWVASAGVDPVQLLARYPRRFSSFHVKDIKAAGIPNYAFELQPAPLGQGTIDWPALLNRAYAAHVRQFYVEQEAPFVTTPLDAAADSMTFLRAVH
jgi:sugar phosphate isomerase/epimerase